MKQKAAVPSASNWAVKKIREFPGSPSEKIGDGWMLITSGNTDADAGNWNTMTASWGGLGVLWARDVAFVVVRPSRNTFDFMNNNFLFTLSFFDEKYRGALDFCGVRSGRDTDKAAETGLSPIVIDGRLAGGKIAGAVAFEEAENIVVCRKMYAHDFDPAKFLDPSMEDAYHGKDYHRLFFAEIIALLVKEV
jgi:flavin reductase (DIM6/NTAB) family NADH-FMN oxidoreductase RutF